MKEDILTLLDEDMDEEKLPFYFTKSETGSRKGLLMIGDLEQRVKAEMGIGPDSGSRFIAERFAVVYDALVLAKLAPLDNQALALLAQAAACPRTPRARSCLQAPPTWWSIPRQAWTATTSSA